jgi:hypothetical protein
MVDSFKVNFYLKSGITIRAFDLTSG